MDTSTLERETERERDMVYVRDRVEKEKKEIQRKHVNGLYDEEGDAMSVYDAALIYQANDYNENYMFGYTHEQLMDALEMV